MKFAIVLDGCADPPGCPQQCALPPHVCPKSTSGKQAFGQPANKFPDLALTAPCQYFHRKLPVSKRVYASFGRDNRASSRLAVSTGSYSAVTEKKVIQQSSKPWRSFIHGGDFRDGYGGGPLYDGMHLANSSKIIVVTINYRLSILGFLYTGSGDSESINGNFGFLDQRMAMRWVRENIAAFGGSTSDTTLMGQSAGAESIAAHLVSPPSDPYFDAAMMISEPMGLPFRPTKDASKWARLIASEIGCGNDSTPIINVENCLRSQSTSALLDGVSKARSNTLAQIGNLLFVFNPWGPIPGTSELPTQPLFALSQGNYNQGKPVVAGLVHSEGWLFVYSGFGFAVPEDLFDILLGLIFSSEAAPKLKQRYPIPQSMVNDTRPIISNIATDGLFRCPLRHAIQGMRNTTGEDVWMYHYNHLSSFSKQQWGKNKTECYEKVCHGSDLPYWFRPNLTPFGFNFTEEEYILADTMSEFSGNFAKNHNPGTSTFEGIKWEQYKTDSVQDEKSMYFETPKIHMREAPFEAICDFWDNEIGYGWVNGDK